ncbi:MAG: 1-(5-phosphoribosyl)-5-[(5-phosphoribosylamino)methylideneamino]imidazole-4-carboxamide isomerase [Chloroflexi bacterium]|nr:1-(5-phosphoribosyl)-5-[(5-phosphoribosylamino)methylideneamino]imidazole-4-carboxamide isomerase [Chloroflexota bacterium]
MIRFEPIPAIDIRDGRCVRLVQGDYGRQTVYGDDPADMARHWQAQGARRLHVVDLDAARSGGRENAAEIRRLLAAVDIPVQVGGGVRSLDTARALLADGADRVVVGSALAEEPARAAAWVDALTSARLVVAVDARGRRVAVHGWLDATELDIVSFARHLAEAGVRRVLYTDIGRDGMLSGPDVEGTRALVDLRRLHVLGSGGVAGVEHLRELASAGAEGAIVGTALYDGRLALSDALAVGSSEAAAC